MPKLYQYTILHFDGSKEVLEPRKKMSLDELYKTLDCRTVETIPTDYFADGMNKRATIYGDEEGRRFDGTDRLRRNQHMKVLKGDLMNPEMEWDCVGDLLMEEVYHAEKS